MTDDEIVKALECCKTKACDEYCSEECPMRNDDRTRFVLDCKLLLADEIVKLIKRQKAEIERLNKILHTDFYIAGSRAIGKTEYLRNAVTIRVDAIKEAAIKQFAERLKGKQKQINITYHLDYDVVFVSDIDNLVKEMVGDKE